MLVRISVGRVLVVLLAGCGSGSSGGGLPAVPSPPYEMIAGAPTAVNNLGYLIAQEQRSVVTPGGDELQPGFSAVDQSNFDSSNRLQAIVNDFKNNIAFAPGVAALKTLPQTDPGVTQQQVLTAFSRPLYPTWAMNGHIGSDGTTDAGYAVEQEIATALTNTVMAAVQSS